MTKSVLLGGYAAKQCPVRAQNDFSPAVQTREWEPSPEDQARLDAGKAFEAAVFAQLTALHPGSVLVDPDLRKDDAITATVAAMDGGVGLILGGWLPDDPAGGRTGRPDLLDPCRRRLPAWRREEPQDGQARHENRGRAVTARATCVPTVL